MIKRKILVVTILVTLVMLALPLASAEEYIGSNVTASKDEIKIYVYNSKLNESINYTASISIRGPFFGIIPLQPMLEWNGTVGPNSNINWTIPINNTFARTLVCVNINGDELAMAYFGIILLKRTFFYNTYAWASSNVTKS